MRQKTMYLLKRFFHFSLTLHMSFLFAFPASTNYQLKSFEFGGGGASMDSTNYSLNATLGEMTASQSSTNFSVQSGLTYVTNANTPNPPTLVNSGNWYNKLLLTLNASNNPSDSTFAIAITSDNWATTQYIQSDNTVGATLGAEDWQIYTAWGGGSGEYIIGLIPDTTYQVKVKAEQGEFSETPWGPTAQAATSDVTLNFDIDIHASDTETAPPYAVSLGALSAGSVTTASNKIWVDLDTNAEFGGYVYIYDQYAGLQSAAVSHTIGAVSSNLASASEGYGIRVDTTTSLTAVTPYNGSSDNVGIIDTTTREILHSGYTAVSGGRASIVIKAKINNTTPAANDYTDTLTLIASGTF